MPRAVASSFMREPARFCAVVGAVSTLMIGSLGSSSLGLIAGPCSGYCVTSSSTGRFSASRIVTMRAPWITLPAPTPITRSACAARAASVARVTDEREVSLSISSNTPASRSPSSSRMREMSGVLRDTVRPQTMKARRAPLPRHLGRQPVERVLAAVEAEGVVHSLEVVLYMESDSFLVSRFRCSLALQSLAGSA